QGDMGTPAIAAGAAGGHDVLSMPEGYMLKESDGVTVIYDWHPRFAWRPIRFVDGSSIWLRTYDRRVSVKFWMNGSRSVFTTTRPRRPR
ncbi:MAG: hypothetical protein ACREB5_09250, partial [Sphingomonadaceae bacterium]